MTITVSTDGSALGNPNGPMGWAWADHEPAAGGKPGHEHAGDCDAGGATNGTNQIGELCAVLEALRAHPGSEDLVIETDSQYAINCSTKWVQGWKRNGWKNSQKKPVKNADLIRAIDNEIAHRAGSVRFVWVKGHAGNAGNEKVDELARTYAASDSSVFPDSSGSAGPPAATARSRVRSPACWRSRKAFPTTLRISDRQPMTTQMMRWKRPCSRPNRRKPPAGFLTCFFWT